ncbi:fimbrial protein [Aeromonas veronii]|uniref:fimbrial protein n=1 Tax=Aeromonas veronii TaxID=654 RepID=UPI00191D5058|nr:fimbrial protein [Aeromonas veronii]MBL0616797.1 fimbrial protein [Aeromonas veronii]
MLRKASIAGLLLSVLYPEFSYGNGYVYPDSGTYEYNIDLGQSDIQNKKGYVTDPPMTWDLGQQYSAHIDCSNGRITGPTYFKAVMNESMSPIGDGFMKLNEFLDMKVEIWFEGNRKAYVKAPFTEESNRLTWTCRSQSESFSYRSGSKGKVTFRVRKPIINGVQIADRKVVEMFGRLGGNATNGYGPVAMSRIIIKSAILYVPERCVINGGQTIEIEFGDLPGSGLDGNSFEKTLPLNFRCEGGEFEGDALKIKLGISGKRASFNEDYLRTTRDGYQGGNVISDLGIKFKQLDGSPLQLNKFYPVSMQGNIGDWGFIAAPVTPTGADIPAGDFYATATIVAEFQ